MKLSVGLIVRNGGSVFAECLANISPMLVAGDEVIIGLAGESTDDTERTTRDYAALVNEAGVRSVTVLVIPWTDDFSAARNEVLDAVAKDATHFMWVDSDDLLVDGPLLRAEADRNPANCLYVPYDYEQDEYGNVTCQQLRERIVRDPHLWRWEGRVHENLILDRTVEVHIAQSPVGRVVHNPKRNRDKGERNLRLLYRELQATEPTPKSRTLIYLARENATHGRPQEAILHAERYLRGGVKEGESADEAAQLQHLVATMYRDIGDLDRAAIADLAAISLQPSWPDAYFGLARTAYMRHAWDEVIEWTKAGATKNEPVTGLITDPLDYSFRPQYFVGMAYAQKGDVEKALGNLRQAASVVPEPSVLAAIRALTEEHEMRQTLDAFLRVYEHLGKNDEWIKARRIFAYAPKLIEQHPLVREAWAKTKASTDHIDDPSLMLDFYHDNPGWNPMPEEVIFGEPLDGKMLEWGGQARVAFALRSLCPAPSWVLDVGSADGIISLPLAAAGHIIKGFDLDERCVALANKRAQGRGLRASYTVGSVDDVTEYYDTAIAFEIIEHLVDPAAFLDGLDTKANTVLLTTPFLSWEGGHNPNWDTVVPKGHLRIFDLNDIERLLNGRGRILDLYRHAYGPTGWIFASYRPRTTYRGTVTFLAPNTLEEWSPLTFRDKGLGGSETALIRLAEELFVQQDLLCTTYGRIKDPGYHNGVRYRQADHFLPEVNQDVFIAWRYPEAADLPIATENMILWMHDVDAGDRLTPERAYRFKTIVVLSEWHKQHMLDTYPWLHAGHLTVIGNGVDKDRFTQGEVIREPHRVVYTSSPDRGLDIILAGIWPKVVEAVPDAELHVYYGWQNFDATMNAYPQLRAFKDRIGQLTLDTKNVVNHGRVNQQMLADELRRASVWLYPTYFDETYCISAIEAQLAGVIPIINRRAALAETATSGIDIEGDVRDPEVQAQYADAVIYTLLHAEDAVTTEDTAELLRSRIAIGSVAQGWDDVADRWMDALGLEREQPEPI